MATTTVRVDRRTQEVLRELAERTGKSMQAILADAVEAYQRERFFDDLDAAYEALQSDPAAWREERAERQLWENTLADGLEEA